MSEEVQKLRAKLAQLNAELGAVEEVDPAMRERLAAALDDVHAALEGQAPKREEAEEEASIADQLSEGMRHFEETHPNLAGMLGSVIDALARMGI